MQLEFCKNMCLNSLLLNICFCETVVQTLSEGKWTLYLTFPQTVLIHYNPSKMSNSLEIPTDKAVITCVILDVLYYLLSTNCREIHSVYSLTYQFLHLRLSVFINTTSVTFNPTTFPSQIINCLFALISCRINDNKQRLTQL